MLTEIQEKDKEGVSWINPKLAPADEIRNTHLISRETLRMLLVSYGKIRYIYSSVVIIP